SRRVHSEDGGNQGGAPPYWRARLSEAVSQHGSYRRLAAGMVDRSFPERQTLPKDLMVFHHFARALTSSLDLDSILGAIMLQMEQFFEPESWSLLIVDEEQQNLYYAVAAGKSSGARNLRVG